ncbi:MAG: sulfite oxidase [Burkholderiales bacterium]|nr:sulfite oxidase [Burkholderiales bacterium]
MENPRRRQLLAGSVGALAAAGLSGWSSKSLAEEAKPKPLPVYVNWKDADDVIVHSSSTLETRREAFGTSVITPADQLYIRNNLPAPDASIVADRDAWQIALEGVKNPRSLTVGELKSMGLETVAMVLQCSGNGRGFFPHKPSGTPWTVGAAGCTIWSGVPVRAVVEALGGVGEGVRFMTGTGGEKLPDGIDPKTVIVERSIPLQAMNQALLAWEMNGEPVPMAHGGPLRLIVPGYYGVNHIKYIKRLALTAEETDAKIQKTGYRMSPIGEKGNPSQPSVLAMTVKSWINHPSGAGDSVRAGLMQIDGVAFGGINGVKGVEVSWDGGKAWKEATFVGPDMGRYAWRQFVFPVKLKAGTYRFASRATDSQGNVQPEARVENASGYSNTSWHDHAVEIVVS